MRRARQAQGARQPSHRVPGFHHRRKVREIGLDVGFDALAITLFWIDQVDGQAQGQAIAVNPHLPLAGHRLELARHIQGQPGRQFALLDQVLLQLVAQMLRKGGAVYVKRET